MKKTLDRYEYLKLLNELDYKHGSFYHLWEMGRPRFVQGEEAKRVLTGAVSFSREGHFLEFLINEDFWKTLNWEQKTFLIGHECLHVTYNHGYRLFRHAKSQYDATLMNFACDIVINHRLVELGFNRKQIDPDNKFCWLDTVFPDRDDVKPNRSSEYYYKKLREQSDEMLDKLKEMLTTVDQHMAGDGEGEESEKVEEFQDMTGILEELADRLTDQEMNEVAKDFEEKHKELDEEINKDVPQSKEPGTSPGNILKRVQIRKVKQLEKWETVIKRWVKKTLLDEFQIEEQWARTARRFELLEQTDLILPSEMETDEPLKEKHKVGVYFFMDTSISCVEYADRFWKAAASVPQKYFDVRLFCFDTAVYETSLESGELKGFGGTAFAPIEREIQQIMNQEDKSYPDAVFLITDGWGNDVHPQHPDRWHWFMTEGYRTSNVPKKSHVHKLEDFE